MRDYEAEVRRARAVGEREQERQNKNRDDLEAAIAEWNVTHSHKGFIAMPFGDWTARAERAGQGLNARGSVAYPSDAPGGVRYKGGLPGKIDGHLFFRFGTEPTLDQDNAIRLLVAQRTGLLSEQPRGPNIVWPFSYGSWPQCPLGVIVVHKEWALWSFEADW